MKRTKKDTEKIIGICKKIGDLGYEESAKHIVALSTLTKKDLGGPKTCVLKSESVQCFLNILETKDPIFDKEPYIMLNKTAGNIRAEWDIMGGPSKIFVAFIKDKHINWHIDFHTDEGVMQVGKEDSSLDVLHEVMEHVQIIKV